jgi:hypothetical protein
MRSLTRIAASRRAASGADWSLCPELQSGRDSAPL